MINTRYYYSGLSEKNKKIYRAIYDGIKNYKKTVEVPGVDLANQNVGYIYHCVLWDNPFFFTIGEYAMQKAVTHDRKRINITTLCDRYTEQERREQVEKVVNEILRTPGLNEMTDFQKEVFVHDFIINNVEYDETHGDGGRRLEPYTIYGVFVERKAVCEGIAKAVKLLLDLLNVKCIVVDGFVQGNGHAWNIVKIDGFSYHLDVTFDMGQSVNKGKIHYDYFNLRDEDLSDRTIHNKDLMPKCFAIEYNYVIKAGGYVSNKERLYKYMENCLQKGKPCMYLKINRSVNEEFKDISKYEFDKIIQQTLNRAVRNLRIHAEAYIIYSSKMQLWTLEITY